MSDRNNSINDYTETSTSSPLRTRPTDKQMGLGTHNFFKNKVKKDNQKSNS
ncbi:hypothetical protein [Clostridium sp. DJ247]|uniref:hypothetical protein n=1 Tax=Clostridium sp. DJ247 TaxID=2726188 RepID=UPI00162A7B03|nr:hypothetical protein [Clostridium sp. DJ247]MBC2581359.1 hypothetical protein [Clostridium sp. DJ247]